MKKEILISTSAVVVVFGFIFLTRSPESNSGTLFEAETEALEADEIVYENETVVVSVPIEEETVLHGTVFVDVQGEVVNPGVFEVNSDVRIGYLIDLAGGLTNDATTRGLNQAARIYDEMVIFVPHVDDDIDIVTLSVTERSGSDSGLISLSTASALELQSLPGIGPALSANIIAHREANGLFSTIDELVNVAGIGARIVENVREYVKP